MTNAASRNRSGNSAVALAFVDFRPEPRHSMHTLLDDLRFASRMFGRRRRFATLLVATIAIGIGAATSIFSLIDVVLWKPLPYRDASRLYWIARTDDTWRASPVLSRVWDNLGHMLSDYQQWATTQRSFEATAAWFVTNGLLTTDNGVEQVPAARATASLTTLLGVQPVLGRWFLPGEDTRGDPRIAVLSYESWRTRFGGDSSIVGRALTFNGVPTDVVGVLPRGFRVAGDTNVVEVWTPAGTSANDWSRGNFNFRVYGRLAPNVSFDAAAREAIALIAPEDRPKASVRLENLQAETVKTLRTPLALLLSAALLLLVIACGNVATLLVGETTARETEMATRVSLGATGARLARHLLTENLLLAVIGGIVGCALAAALVRVLRVMAPNGIPRIETAHVDARGVWFAVVVTLVAAVVFSLGPLAAVLRSSPASLLRAGSGRFSRQRGAIERGGVFIQSALVVLLLAGAALLVRTHQQLVAVDPGFPATKLLGVRLRIPAALTRYRDPQAQLTLLDEIATRLAGVPGIANAAAGHGVPFQDVSSTDIRVAASAAVTDQEAVAGTYIIASSRFFETMGIPIRAGRAFGPQDQGPGTAAIVSETFARRFWPNAAAVGQRIRVDNIWRDVVGVAGDVRHRSVDEDVRATFYLPAAQALDRTVTAVVLRTSVDPRTLIPAVRRVVAEVDPGIAIARADRLSDRVDATLVVERFRTVLLSIFAVTAVLLAAVGIVGVGLNAAARRRRELAIRMAVGATPASILRLVAESTLVVATSGAALGVVLALGVTRAMRPFLYGVSSADPLTYAVVLVLIVAVAACAAFVPARRATHVDLMRTLSD